MTHAGIILLFVLLAVVFRKFDVGGYRTLPDAARLIFVSHNAFFLMFLLTAAPYSFAVVSLLFAPSSPSNLLEKSIYRCLSFPLAFQVVMYAVEVGDNTRDYWQACMCKASRLQHASTIFSAQQVPVHSKQSLRQLASDPRHTLHKPSTA